jgi:hypothetical protein
LTVVGCGIWSNKSLFVVSQAAIRTGVEQHWEMRGTSAVGAVDVAEIDARDRGTLDNGNRMIEFSHIRSGPSLLDVAFVVPVAAIATFGDNRFFSP